MYGKILVPVDGSSTSLKGLAEALKLAGVLKARIRLLHVVNELILDPALTPSVYYDRLIEGMRETGKAILDNARTIATQQGTDVEVELVESIGGRASDYIVAAAQQWPADLIVMGTHGRRGVSRLTMGSDAELVARSAPVPVLLVAQIPH